MLKLKFLILFIAFIQVVPDFINILESKFLLLEDLSEKKWQMSDGKYIKIENTTQCIKRNPILVMDDNGSKCCFVISNLDPFITLKKLYGEIGKKF